MEEKRTSEMMSAKEAGLILGVSSKTIHRLRLSEDLPSYQIGSVWKFKRSEVEAYRDGRRFHRQQGSEDEAKKVA